VPSVDLDAEDGVVVKKEITIRMSLIDERFRPNHGSGNSKECEDRHIDQNQGVSIMRNGREVFYGPIPYWPGDRKWFNEKDRWWGCEISFTGELDRVFTVKNIKRGAVPNKELKAVIFEKIKGTRNTCLEKVSDVWKREKLKREQEKDDGGPQTGHEDSEKIAKKTSTDKSQIDRNKDIDETAKGLIDRIAGDETEAEKSQMVAKWKSQPFTIHDSNWRGPLFMEIDHMGGADVIQYNRSHSFFEAVYNKLAELEEEEANFSQAKDLKILIDLLLIAFSKAEAKFEPESEFKAESFLEMLSANWGMYLKSYVDTWKSESSEEDSSE